MAHLARRHSDELAGLNSQRKAGLMDADLIRRVPNWLTFSRIAVVPFFVLLMHYSWVGLATLVFALAALTDCFDGWIARRYDAITDLGKMLDPLADKILVMSALVMLTARGWVPGWLVVMVLAREIWVTGLRSMAAGRGQIVPANEAGKLKLVLQIGAVFLLLLHDLGSAQAWGYKLLLLATLISYGGAFQYTHQVLWHQQPDG